ncbi:RNA polymerase sigma factor [Luteolibacter luteus]|uniref:Sigma-70 family RNA polymerase sigma factor n=1 Tax=Luteolibacter luteus TaxID=2728835 RepID=A0A858RSE8_9BACT|nr:sigma-70 family RNA polymerase sigma factor [Luteolibacter luteus]QJE98863.1 sigma-70 family RNA polymerase sigma factor [Luteolibacter luteus]
MELSDRELLDRFVTNRDEAAFRMLVERHLAVVHGVARRVTANGELARDVAQNAFVRLARRAALIPRDLSLSAWLHRVTHHLAIDMVRGEERRKKRESATHAAAAMDSDPTPPPDWSALAPVVDSLVNRLPAADRDLVLLRFYRNEPHAAIARQLGLSEAAAKKRATRALEKLRALLAKQGIATSAVALAALLPAHAAPPVSGSMILSVSAAAKGILPAAPQGLNLHLAMTTAQKTAVAAAALVFLGSLGYAIRSSPPLPPAGIALASASGAAAGDAKAAARRERGSGLSAEERLEKLRQIMAIPGKLERPRQFLEFIDTLSSKEIAETAGQLQQLKVADSTAEFTMLLEAWTKVDPLGALAWSMETTKGGPHAVILSTWGEFDPEAAVDWVLQNVPQPFTDDTKRSALLSVVGGIAARDPAAAVKALDHVPEEKMRTQSLLFLASSMDGSGKVAELLDAVKPGPMCSALAAWSTTGLVLDGRGDKAIELLLADEGARKIEPLGNLFSLWYYEAPDAALASLEKVPEGPFRDEAAATLCLRAGSERPELSMDLLKRYPGMKSDKLLAQLADEIPVPHALDEMLFEMSDTKLRDEAQIMRLKLWKRWGGEEVRKWMDSHDLSPAVREAVLTAQDKAE